MALLGLPLDGEKLVMAEGRVGSLTGSEECNQITYRSVWQSYLANVLNYDMNLCLDEQAAELQNRSEVKVMPCFADKGGVKMIDGVMVVKFSEDFCE